MGGECYRYARICGAVPDNVQQAYESQVLPMLVAVATSWWDGYSEVDKPQWAVSASLDAGILIQPPGQGDHSAICCPRELNEAPLQIGWQHSSYGARRDPKFEVADAMVDVVVGSQALRGYLIVDKENNIVKDLEGDFGDAHDSSDENEMWGFTACDKESGFCDRWMY